MQFTHTGRPCRRVEILLTFYLSKSCSTFVHTPILVIDRFLTDFLYVYTVVKVVANFRETKMNRKINLKTRKKGQFPNMKARNLILC